LGERQVFRGCLSFETADVLDRTLDGLDEIEPSVVERLRAARFGDRVLVLDERGYQSANLWSEWTVALSRLSEVADGGLVNAVFFGDGFAQSESFAAHGRAARTLEGLKPSRWLPLEGKLTFAFLTESSNEVRDDLAITTLGSAGTAIRALLVNDWFGPLSCLIPDGDHILVIPEPDEGRAVDVAAPSMDVLPLT
jgi:hypothetical protein